VADIGRVAGHRGTSGTKVALTNQRSSPSCATDKQLGRRRRSLTTSSPSQPKIINFHQNNPTLIKNRPFHTPVAWALAVNRVQERGYRV